MDKIKNKVVLSDTELNALEAIQQEAVAGKLSGYTHTFDTPFTFEGRTYDTLTFDFSKLSGDDDIAIENELQALGKPGRGSRNVRRVSDPSGCPSLPKKGSV